MISPQEVVKLIKTIKSSDKTDKKDPCEECKEIKAKLRKKKPSKTVGIKLTTPSITPPLSTGPFINTREALSTTHPLAPKIPTNPLEQMQQYAMLARALAPPAPVGREHPNPVGVAPAIVGREHPNPVGVTPAIVGREHPNPVGVAPAPEKVARSYIRKTKIPTTPLARSLPQPTYPTGVGRSLTTYPVPSFNMSVFGGGGGEAGRFEPSLPPPSLVNIYEQQDLSQDMSEPPTLTEVIPSLVREEKERRENERRQKAGVSGSSSASPAPISVVGQRIPFPNYDDEDVRTVNYYDAAKQVSKEQRNQDEINIIKRYKVLERRSDFQDFLMSDRLNA